MLRVFVDANFAGNFDKNESHIRDTATRSRYGYVIMYKGVPMHYMEIPIIDRNSSE